MIRLALLLALGAGPAAALSCLAPDPARTYAERDAAAAPYHVVEGHLDFDPAALPRRRGLNGSDPARRVPARLTGRALGPDGFGIAYSRDVVIAASCAGPWCPALAPGPVLAFVAARDGVIELGACGGDVFPAPPDEDLARVAACGAGDCRPGGY